MPQASIRFLMFMVSVSALAMFTFRMAFVADQFWAKIGSLLISTVVGCFLVYAALFFVVNLFTATTAPIRQAFDPIEPLYERERESDSSHAGHEPGDDPPSAAGDS